MLMVYGSGYRYHREPGDTLERANGATDTSKSLLPLMPPKHPATRVKEDKTTPGFPGCFPNHACFVYRSASLRGLLMSVRHTVNKSVPLSNPQITSGGDLRRGTVGTPRTIFTAAPEVPPSDAGNMCKQKTARRSHRRAVA